MDTVFQNAILGCSTPSTESTEDASKGWFVFSLRIVSLKELDVLFQKGLMHRHIVLSQSKEASFVPNNSTPCWAPWQILIS